MKRYTEIEPEVLATMGEQQIADLIELEIAHAGIQPVPEPTTKLAPFDQLVPKVTGYTIGNLVFATEAEAQQVASMMVLKEVCDYSVSYDHKWLEPDEKTVKIEHYYTEEDVHAHQSVLKEQKAKKSQREAEQSAYNAYVKKLADIREKVYVALRQAHDYKRVYDLAQKTWEKFVRLADGNLNVAEKFFKDAYKDNPEIAAKITDFKAMIRATADLHEALKEKEVA